LAIRPTSDEAIYKNKRTIQKNEETNAMKNAGIILLSLILSVNAISCGEDSGGISNPIGDLVLGAATMAGTVVAVYAIDRVLNDPPLIDELTLPDTVVVERTYKFKVGASDPDGNTLTYTWMVDRGRLNQTSGNTVTWTAPGTEGEVEIEVRISDGINQPIVQSKIIKVIKIKPLELGMVKIPAGEFLMGSNEVAHFRGDDEKPVHTVYLDEFYMDKCEVTNEQYARFLNAIGQNEDVAGHELLELDSVYCLIEKVGYTYRPKLGFENHPVIEVSWYGAAAYAQWAGKRLPTEAQWEKAARGGLVGKKYPWGDTLTHDDANYQRTGGRDKWDGTAPVRRFPPNGYSLYDMAGNVREWCADEYDSGYYSKSPKNNPTGPGTFVLFVDNDFTSVKTGRVCRGGSWAIIPYNLRCAYRYWGFPTGSNFGLGFRCVVSSPSIPQ